MAQKKHFGPKGRVGMERAKRFIDSDLSFIKIETEVTKKESKERHKRGK